MRHICVFWRAKCDASNRLMYWLDVNGFKYTSINADSSKGKRVMSTNALWSDYLPALYVGGRLYEYASLFDEKDNLDVLFLNSILGGA